MLKVLFLLTVVFTTLNALALDALSGLPPSTMNHDLENATDFNSKKISPVSDAKAIKKSADVKKALGNKISIESKTINKDGSRTYNVFGETHMAQVKVTAGTATVLNITQLDGDEPAATTAN
jgi:hypothetical protein